MNTFVEINLKEEKLVYLTPPHAPVLVSTISPYGNSNIGAFEQFMVCSNNPPRIILIINSDSDTYKNIFEGSDFCIGVPTLSMIDKIYACGFKISRNKSEFKFTKLKPKKSRKIKALRIMECSINFECALYNMKEVGDHILVIGDVLHAVTRKEILSEDKIKKRSNINAPYYISSGYFFKMGKKIKAKKLDV